VSRERQRSQVKEAVRVVMVRVDGDADEEAGLVSVSGGGVGGCVGADEGAEMDGEGGAKGGVLAGACITTIVRACVMWVVPPCRGAAVPPAVELELCTPHRFLESSFRYPVRMGKALQHITQRLERRSELHLQVSMRSLSSPEGYSSILYRIHG